MAIDRLQDKIRKIKNPTILDLTVTRQLLPPHLLEQEGNFLRAYGRFCMELLEGLRREIAGVRFSYGLFALLGTEGLTWLSKLSSKADSLGYYVLLDIPDAKSTQEAGLFADLIMDKGFPWVFDGVTVSSYIGSDGFKEYVPYLKECGKDLFVLLRTPNKSAAEVQDLMTGGRLVHTALADQITRAGGGLIGKCGYSQLAGVSAAASSNSLQQLRTKYKNLFLLVDGYEIPAVNAKNCAQAFDRLGHGAVVCAGAYITGAWQAELSDGLDYVECAQRAAEKMKFNLSRYVTVL